MRYAAIVLAPVLLGAAIGSASLAQETRASAAAKFSREFAASDTNKDGVLSRAEVQARIARMGAGSAGGAGGGARAIDPVHAKRLADLWFDHADANKDGKVTQAEAQALLAATFRRYDANGDGRIGNDERAAAAAGMRAGR